MSIYEYLTCEWENAFDGDMPLYVCRVCVCMHVAVVCKSNMQSCGNSFNHKIIYRYSSIKNINEVGMQNIYR